MQIAIRAIIPVFAMVFIGFLFHYFKVLEKNVYDALNKMVFNVLMPCLIFSNMWNLNGSILDDLDIIVFSIVGITILFWGSYAIVRHLSLPVSQQSVVIQALFRSNYVLLGLPILSSLYSDLRVISILMVVISPFLNIYSVLAFQLLEQREISIKNELIKIIKNPLIIASLAALIIRLLPVPAFAIDSLRTLGASASPLSLFMLGGTLDFKPKPALFKTVGWVTLWKLVIIPFVFTGIAHLFGFRGLDLASCVLMFGGPTAVVTYSVTKAMEGDTELSGQLVMITSLLSVISLPLFLMLIV